MYSANFYFVSMFLADKCVLTGLNEYYDPVVSRSFNRQNIGRFLKNVTFLFLFYYFLIFISYGTRIGSSQVQFIITDFSKWHSMSAYGQLQNSAQEIILCGWLCSECIKKTCNFFLVMWYCTCYNNFIHYLFFDFVTAQWPVKWMKSCNSK